MIGTDEMRNTSTGENVADGSMGSREGSDYINKQTTVAGQLETLGSKDHPLARQAEARALEGANIKGLSSSTMAIGATEGARMREMKDVAMTDAASATQFGLAQQNLESQLNLSKYEWGNKFTQDAVRFGYDKKLLDVKGKWDEKLTQMDIDSEDRKMMMTAMNTMNSALMNGITAIYNNKDISADKQQEYINKMMENYKNAADTQGSLMSFDFDWKNW